MATSYTREFRLTALPERIDLLALTHKRWASGTSFTIANYTSRDGMNYACILDHVAGTESRPETGANWTVYWKRVLEKDSHYYIQQGLEAACDYYVTDNQDPPTAYLVSSVAGLPVSNSGTIRLFTTLALGQAATAQGEIFRVVMTGNFGAYEYQRTSTGSVLRRTVLIGDKALTAALNAMYGLPVLPADVPGALGEWWGQDGWRWDGRVVPNRQAAAEPLLMLLTQPWNPEDELGSTPARQTDTPDTTDHLGGNNALRLTFTAQAQELTVYRSTQAAPSETYRLRAWIKHLSGGTALRLGRATTGFLLTATSTWTEFATTFDGANDIGVSTNTGNTNGVVAIGGLSAYDVDAGETLPTAAQELVDQNAGHMRAAFARRGSIVIDSNGGINLDGAARGGIVATVGGVSGRTFTNMTMGCFVNVPAVPGGTYGNLMSVDWNTSSVTNTKGQLGLHGTGALAGREGRIYPQPRLGSSTTSILQRVAGQGWQHLAITIAAGGITTLYVNGVPIALGTDAAWGTPLIRRFIFGAYNGTANVHETANPIVGKVQGAYVYDRVLTGAEIIVKDRRGVALLRSLGETVTRKALWLSDGDSLAFNTTQWTYPLAENNAIVPSVHLHNMAEGGTPLAGNVNAWSDTRRKTVMLAKVAAGLQTYQEVWISFIGDIESTWGTPGVWQTWRTNMKAYIDEIKASAGANASRIKVAIALFLPRPGLSPSDEAIEVVRMAANDDLRTNPSLWGADRVMLHGLGTERVNADGTVATAETVPGGTHCGNWRASQAAIRSLKAGSGTLTLSATSGSSFTATAGVGFFVSGHVGQHILALPTGMARIVSINGDGSVATLTTDGNTNTHVAFSATSYTAANWSVTRARSPNAAITLSATSGASFTATAAAGTFNFRDVYRHLVTSAGVARITNVNADGSVATLTTTNVVPTTWTGEAAGTISRDTITYSAFETTSYLAYEWSIRRGVGFYDAGGVHNESPGGRIHADMLAPIVQGWLDATTSL